MTYNLSKSSFPCLNSGRKSSSAIKSYNVGILLPSTTVDYYSNIFPFSSTSKLFSLNNYIYCPAFRGAKIY